MPSWNDVLKEINAGIPPHPIDLVRRKYLAEMHKKTGRNVIAYYSGFLHKSNTDTSIKDSDTNGFMNALHGLRFDKGLDLILHTPGGDVAATEAIVDYLHSIFDGNIRCFVPHLAMSAGTMIAFACKEIFMGKHSSIGPIDPQLGGVAAHGVIEEFNEAAKQVISEPRIAILWQTIISKYHPTFIGECQNAIDLADVLAKKWLVKYMFKQEKNAESKARKIVEELNNHKDTKTHARHIPATSAVEMGLKVSFLEKDKELQDIVLTIHHAYMETFARTTACKIIENHKGAALIISHNSSDKSQ